MAANTGHGKASRPWAAPTFATAATRRPGAGAFLGKLRALPLPETPRMSSLDQALRAALVARETLLGELHGQGTDCYRLFHGSQEGAPGLTVDRYGRQLLVQSFHQPLDRDDLLALHATINAQLGLDLLLVYNDRSQGNSRIDRRDDVYQAEAAALEDLLGHEWGLNYRIRARHPGQDPLLFLDLRNARGWIKAHSAGKSVLNLFAYTCGVGLCAAAGGAREVINLDFAEGNLAVGRENAALNPQLAPMQFVQSDYFPAIRQWAGLPVTARRGQKLPHYPRLDARAFDLVFLDPPAWAKSAFGTVDLLRDYQSLLKPALLATAEGGTLVCCNNLAKVAMSDWRDQVLRCADKLGRPVRDCQVLAPAADFPSLDGQPPLKTLILQL
ncbi:Ribosomal RNA large subunit methyltransferase K/L [compost metagenome]